MIFPVTFLLILGIGTYTDIVPMPILIGYFSVSAITLVFYAKDKASARVGCQRTPEITLHLLAVAGGWPGAMLAQQWLRHKTIKRPFRQIFRMSVFLNITLVIVVLLYGVPYLINTN